MATTPKTVRTYPINSAVKDFTIPFEYLARKFVVVTLIGATRRELILNTEYRFSTPTTITTTKAWGPSDNFNLIEIRRMTSATERLVDFADGSILRAYDLNISSVQSLHIAEEARDLTADTIGVNNDGNLDARARKIVNLADGVEDGDAVNLRQQKQWAGSALNRAQAAAASAQAAANSSAAANNSANNSAGSASSSLTYSQNSANSASASQTSRLASETAKTASETARDLSQAWSSKAEDSVVSGGLYSSYHYSRKSAASATASQTSAANSAASATTAAGSVTAAQAQADRAKTEADKLANFNGLAGAINSVVGVNVSWKGNLYSLPGAGGSTGFYARNDVEANFGFSKADGTDVIRFVRTADRTITVYDDAKGSRATFGVDGSSYPKTLWVAGLLTAAGGLYTAGAINTGSLSATGAINTGSLSATGAINTGSLSATGEVATTTTVRAGLQFLAQVPASGDNAANVHVWMRSKDGTERGLIYGDSALQLHIRANGGSSGEAVVINASNYPQLNGLDVAHRADRQTTFFKSGVGANASMYGNCQLQLQAADGGLPALGFHSAGRYAAALYLNSDNRLYLMNSSGGNARVITSDTFQSDIASLTSSDSIGSYALMVVGGGGGGGGTTPGSLVAGGNLRYSATGWINNGSGSSGTWRLMGSVFNADGSGTDSITLCQRVG